MRQHTDAELEEARRILSDAKPLFNELKTKQAAEVDRWQREIEMLERRVKTQFEEVDLGNGDKIAVRTALSEAEISTLMSLESDTKELPQGSPEYENLMFKRLEIMTANPMMTAGWFKANRDRWAVSDVVQIVTQCIEKSQQKMINRARETENFR